MILGDLDDVHILLYLYDILIYSAIAEDHTRYIKSVFEWLVKSKFYLKCKKCSLFLPKVEFLVHIILEHVVI